MPASPHPWLPLLLLAACHPTAPDDSGDTTDTSETGDTGLEVGPIDVLAVAPDGSPVAAGRVRWFDPEVGMFPSPDAGTAIPCADGTDEDCARWRLEGDLPARIHILANLLQLDREPPEPPDDATICAWFDSQFTVVHTGPAAQTVHLVLDPEQVWCDDGSSLGYLTPWIPPTVHPDDERVSPEPVEARLTVRGTEQDGLPLPMANAHWYYHPHSEEYDGEHPLACADALCTAFALPEGEGPAAPPFYVNATYYGPWHPWPEAQLHDYQGAPITEEPLPEEVTLQFDTRVTIIE